MVMRETVGSLRAYFIVLGIFSCVSSLFALFARPVGLGTAFSLAGVGLAAAYLYLGMRLKALLVTSPRQVVMIVLVGGAFTVFALIISLFLGSISGMAQGALGLLITWYLYNNVRRLSSASAALAPPT